MLTLRFTHLAFIFFLTIAIPSTSFLQTTSTSSIEIMPLSDIRPGMKGEWWTVVEGSQIEKFPLEVLDILPSFLGPQQPAIFCNGLDDKQRAIGTVAGMSGSPVFIEGKLVGAYAYGFPWPKDQSLIGLSPIEKMMEVLAMEDTSVPAAVSVEVGDKENSNAKIGMQPLPIVLAASGFSSEVMSHFDSKWDKLGLKLMAIPAGSTSSHTTENKGLPLGPGSPIATVLLGGDFTIAAIGTVTWRKDDLILAFGHPFLRQGPVAIPMAEAEIVAIVQSYNTSFKLPKIGKVIGSIFQDRISAIAGRIGQMAPTTALTFNITLPDQTKYTHRGDLLYNRNIGPTIAAMGLQQSIQGTMANAAEQTYNVKTTIEVEGFEPIIQNYVATGPKGPASLADDFFASFDLLLSNKFEFPQVKAVTFDITITHGIQRIDLLEAQIISGDPKPGKTLELRIVTQPFLGNEVITPVQINLPKNRSSGTMQIRIGDASMANNADKGEWPSLGFRSLNDVINFLRQQRPSNAIYVQLVQEADGMQFRGEPMANLPSSVFSLYKGPQSCFKAMPLDVEILQEIIIPQSGVCTTAPCIFNLTPTTKK